MERITVMKSLNCDKGLNGEVIDSCKWSKIFARFAL